MMDVSQWHWRIAVQSGILLDLRIPTYLIFFATWLNYAPNLIVEILQSQFVSRWFPNWPVSVVYPQRVGLQTDRYSSSSCWDQMVVSIKSQRKTIHLRHWVQVVNVVVFRCCSNLCSCALSCCSSLVLLLDVVVFGVVIKRFKMHLLYCRLAQPPAVGTPRSSRSQDEREGDRNKKWARSMLFAKTLQALRRSTLDPREQESSPWQIKIKIAALGR